MCEQHQQGTFGGETGHASSVAPRYLGPTGASLACIALTPYLLRYLGLWQQGQAPLVRRGLCDWDGGHPCCCVCPQDRSHGEEHRPLLQLDSNSWPPGLALPALRTVVAAGHPDKSQYCFWCYAPLNSKGHAAHTTGAASSSMPA